MDSSVSGKDEIWFLRVCHHVPHELYLSVISLLYLHTTSSHPPCRYHPPPPPVVSSLLGQEIVNSPYVLFSSAYTFTDSVEILLTGVHIISAVSGQLHAPAALNLGKEPTLEQ